MNERIKLLAQQAVEETQLMMIMQYTNFESTLYQKFAELIVQECADTVLGFRNQFGDSAQDEIREHFGVSNGYT